MRVTDWPIGVMLGALLCACPARAEPQTLMLQPGQAEIGFRAYGLGFLPIDGQFTRLSGTLALDPADPGLCRIQVRAETASLRMPDDDITADAQGPDLLDVARFPTFEYSGTCTGSQLDGTLLLHGVTRPLQLRVTHERNRWSATGPMRRADWGMGARPNLAGPEVRIRFTVMLPPGFPAQP